MADQNQTDVEDRLWKEIDKGRFGMLGLVGEEHRDHFQPMTAYPERKTGTIWFFTRDDTDLAKAANGGMAMMTFQTKDQDLHACLGGQLWASRDPERIEKFWNPILAAWYPEGKDDPHLTLLRLDLDSAAVWLSDAGPVKFAYEIARANIKGQKPDLGDRAEIQFN